VKVDYGSLPPWVLALVTPLGLLSEMDFRAQLRSRVARDGKFTKFQVLYFPVTPILPVAWFYHCADCVFYQKDNRTCELVQGGIAPLAWCGLWTNRQEDRPFSWVGRAVSRVSRGYLSGIRVLIHEENLES